MNICALISSPSPSRKPLATSRKNDTAVILLQKDRIMETADAQNSTIANRTPALSLSKEAPRYNQSFVKELARPNARIERHFSKNERQNYKRQERPACNKRYILLPKPASFSVSASKKLSCNLTHLRFTTEGQAGQCFVIGNKNIPPNRYAYCRQNLSLDFSSSSYK